jgi:SAM-dependent methyltransferase
MSNWSRYVEQNRRAWNEIAATRAASYRESAFPAAFFAGGGCSLDERVVVAAGDMRGKRLLHLMSATGEEALSWAVLGARVVGVDISEAQVALARAKAEAAEVPARFVPADVGALPAALTTGRFDWVYSGTGTLVWIPEIDPWAINVARALTPGGRLLLWEEHPLATCFSGLDGEPVVVDEYFRSGAPIERQGWNHFLGGERANEVRYQFTWTLGDIVTAIASAGMRIERLSEYPTDAEWRFGDALHKARRLPGRILLLARRPRPDPAPSADSRPVSLSPNLR